MNTLTIVLDRRELADFYALVSFCEDTHNDEIDEYIDKWQDQMEYSYRKHFCTEHFIVVLRNDDVHTLKRIINHLYIRKKWSDSREKRLLENMYGFLINNEKQNIYPHK